MFELESHLQYDIEQLRQEIENFYQAYNAQIQADVEGEDTTFIAQSCAEAAAKIRQRIRYLANGWGIHREYLQNYEQLRSALDRPKAEIDLAAF